MVAPQDPEALAVAMIELFKQPATVQSANARMARKWVVEHYNEERAVGELSLLYREVVLA